VAKIGLNASGDSVTAAEQAQATSRPGTDKGIAEHLGDWARVPLLHLAEQVEAGQVVLVPGTLGCVEHGPQCDKAHAELGRAQSGDGGGRTQA
jgi:hypothetical protein